MAKEELLICHIHGVVRKDNNMEIIEESNDEKTICFKHNNVKYKVQLTDINEYLLEIDDNTVATGVDYKYVIDTLNTRCATTSF